MILTKKVLAGWIAAALTAGAGAGVAVNEVIELEGKGVRYYPRMVATADSACLASVKAYTDTARLWHTKSGQNKQTEAQKRAALALRDISINYCQQNRITVDSVLVDSLPPVDTLPLPQDSLPSIRVTLQNVTGRDTLFIRPTTPFMLFFLVYRDSLPVSGDSGSSLTLSDSTMAKVHWNRSAQRYEVYTEATHTKVGPLTLTALVDSAASTYTITVASAASPPTDTTTVPPPIVTDSTALGILTSRIGPTRTLTQALTDGLGTTDSTFLRWEATRWSVDGDLWSASNYYDRSKIYYAWWARTGNPLYKVRGDLIALNYRRNYLHPANYQTSPHWSQLDGLALHYWYTGDDSSRIAVGKAAWNLAPTLKWPRTGLYTDARQQGRALIGVLLAWQMSAPNAPVGGWAKALDEGLDNILSQQSPDGAWRYPVNTCDLSLNYMGAILADALIRVHDTYRPDPRIPPAVQKTADFLRTQWRSGDPIPSFNYYEATCANQHGTAGPTATADLTGLYTTMYAWMARRDPSYSGMAMDVIRNTMRGIYPYGTKQFNQAFTFTWRSLGYLP